MDDERVGGESSADGWGGENCPRQLTLGEFIREECPRYLAMGVSYDEYWNGDYTRLPYYRKAYALKRHEENEKLWLQGVYFLRAIGCIVPNSDESYPNEPLPLTEEEASEREARKQREAFYNAKTYMETMMHNINKQRREGGGNNGGAATGN